MLHRIAMATNDQLIATARRTYLGNYRPAPIVLTRGEGRRLWDADGRRYLVMHGDEFDVVVRYAKWLALFGDWSYMMALWANTHFNAVRRFFGMPYWSLSAYLKHKVKRAVNYIGEFEGALAAEARRHGAQGVICGHIHHTAMRQVGDVLYINTGDWVESCTAVGETEDGLFEIIRWSPHRTSRVQIPVEEFEAAA